MHIPDGFLDPWVIVLFYLGTLIFWYLSSRKAKRILGDRHVPVLAVMAAAVFAAQMINWPIGPGGTTAHLVGGALISMYLGPYGGLIAMSIILVIQCLLFGDGGITALGANVWNMGIVDCIIGYYVYRGISQVIGDDKGRVVGAFIGAWFGITLAAFFCGLQIGVSSRFPYGWALSIPIMTIYHGVIGVMEGLITSSVIAYTLKARHDLLDLPKVELP